MTDIEEFERMREQVQKRLKPSRYAHCMGVSQTAEQLARIYGADERAAAVAGLLHDWDKSLSFEELRAKAKEYKCASAYVRKNMPGVLHGYTAAQTLKQEFPTLTKAELKAIKRHTCGAKKMSDLDKIVFVADIIEPGRVFPDIEELRDAVGVVSLDELYFLTYRNTLVYLIQDGLPVHPDSLDVYNALVAKRTMGA